MDFLMGRGVGGGPTLEFLLGASWFGDGDPARVVSNNNVPDSVSAKHFV